MLRGLTGVYVVAVGLSATLLFGLASAFVLGQWGWLIGPAVLLAVVVSRSLLLPRGLEPDVDRPRLMTVLKLVSFAATLVLMHFAVLQALRIHPALAVWVLGACTFYIVQRLVMPTFLFLPATKAFIPVFRAPRRILSDGGTLGSVPLLVTVIVVRLSGLVMLFSGWTVFWWSRSVLHSSVPGGGPAVLGAAERTFLWETANALPVVELPATIGWTRPADLTGAAAGGTILLFKILVLLPMAATLIYFFRGVWERRPDRPQESHRTVWQRLTGRTGAGPGWFKTVVWSAHSVYFYLVVEHFTDISGYWVLLAFGYLLLRQFLFRRTSDDIDLITGLPHGIPLPRMLVYAAVLLTVPYAYETARSAGLAATITLLVIVTWLVVLRIVLPQLVATPVGAVLVPFLRAPESLEGASRQLRAAPRILLLYALRMLGLVVLLGLWLMFAVAQGWLGSAARGWLGSAGSGLPAAEELFAWHTLDAIPLLDIPETFGWTQPAHPAGIAYAIVLVIFKVVALVPLAAALIYFIRALWERDPIMPERLEDGPPVPWTGPTGGWDQYVTAAERWRANREREQLATIAQAAEYDVDEVYAHSAIALEAARTSRRRALWAARGTRGDRRQYQGWIDYAAGLRLVEKVVEEDLRRRTVRASYPGAAADPQQEQESKERMLSALLVYERRRRVLVSTGVTPPRLFGPMEEAEIVAPPGFPTGDEEYAG